MKFISLIFVVAFIAATGSLLGAMSTVASAQPSASDALANTATLGLADASATRLTGSLPRPFAAAVTAARRWPGAAGVRHGRRRTTTAVGAVSRQLGCGRHAVRVSVS